MDSVLVEYASLTASRTLFATITSLPELYFRFRTFIVLVQTKKVISMNYGSSTSSWKPRRWVRLELSVSMRDIYINSNLNAVTKFTTSSRSSEFNDILWWNISQMITKTVPISTRILISNAMKQGILLWIWWKVNGNWDNNKIRISQWRENHCRTNTSVRRKKYIRKSISVRITVWNPSRNVNHLNKAIWDRAEFIRSISSTRIGKPVLMMDVKVSKDKHICWWVDWENLIYVR